MGRRRFGANRLRSRRCCRAEGPPRPDGAWRSECQPDPRPGARPRRQS